MPIDPARAALLAAGVATILLAGVILAAGPRQAAHRALAALLGLRGAAILLPQAASDPSWVWAALNVQPYFTLAAVAAAVYCWSVVPHEAAGHKTVARWCMVAGAAVLTLYAFDHALYRGLALGEPAHAALQAGAGVAYTGIGPLSAIGSATPLLLGLLGLKCAMAYRQAPDAPDARVLLLFAGGLMIGALFDGSSRLVAAADLLDDPQGFPFLPWGWTLIALPPLAIVPGVLSMAIIGAGRKAQPRAAHVTERVLLLLGAGALLAGLVRLVTVPDSDPVGPTFILVLLGLFRLAMPMLVAYAVLTQAMAAGVPRTLEVIAWSLTAVALCGLGVVAAVLVGSVAPTPWPLLAGLATATVVAAGGRPVLQLSRALARRLVPIPTRSSGA